MPGRMQQPETGCRIGRPGRRTQGTDTSYISRYAKSFIIQDVYGFAALTNSSRLRDSIVQAQSSIPSSEILLGLSWGLDLRKGDPSLVRK